MNVEQFLRKHGMYARKFYENGLIKIFKNDNNIISITGSTLSKLKTSKEVIDFIKNKLKLHD